MPLAVPWASARGGFAAREGWLIRLETGDGLVGHGDCAPLPQAGTESRACAASRLAECGASLYGMTPEAALDALERIAVAAPAVRCGLETALLDLLSQRAGLGLARWLNPLSSLSVNVNAMIGALGRESLLRARAAVAAGFSVLKLKVGLAPVGHELALLRELAGELPAGIGLRLDANRAWTWAEANGFLGGLSGLPVESLEDPLRTPGAAELARLQAAVAFPLAADEILPLLGAEALLALRPVRRLVLKPMVLGGLRPALVLANRAREAGMECVVTTTVDSAVGVYAALHLAAAVANDLAHGLATSSWLAGDVGLPPQPADGMLTVGRGAGLGFAAR
ncbi:MAG: enolase C-terminal domain-like protein [Sulfuricella sp.]|nr:enolase C-terminal domain-like protein [Sulfuricella sp.]